MADAAGPVGFDGEEDDGDFQVGMADLGIESGDDVLDDEDIEMGFDGVEDGTGIDEPDEPDESSSSSDGDGPSFESAINSGLGRAAVYGLPDDEEKERLNEEFTEIAEAFHVGYFGEQVAEEYLARDIEDVPPELGLAAASIAFAAVVIHRRPDGEMLVQKARWRVQDAREEYFGDDSDVEVHTPEPEEPDAEQPTEHTADPDPPTNG